MTARKMVADRQGEPITRGCTVQRYLWCGSLGNVEYRVVFIDAAAGAVGVARTDDNVRGSYYGRDLKVVAGLVKKAKEKSV